MQYQIDAGRTESPVDSAMISRSMFVDFIRLEHAGYGMATEAGEFLDQLKRHKFYGKPLDRVNLAEECGDLLWYVALACNALDIDMQDVMDRNVTKLKQRYPEKFTDDAALNRNLDAERKVLEQ